MRRALLALALLALIPSCRITLEESDKGDTEKVVTSKPPPEDPFRCPEWDDKPEAEIEQLVEDEIDALEADGVEIDGSLWADPERFETILRRVYASADCELPTSLEGFALHDNEGETNYCGPNHGAVFLVHPNDCMNSACRDHDACYSMCSGKLSKACSFSSTTTQCDQAFLDVIDACPTRPYGLWSGIIRGVAHVVKALNSFKCAGVECPEFGDLGSGPCSTNPDDPVCRACLAASDPDAECHDRACSDEPNDAYCYAANCEEVGQCYGGYGYSSLLQDAFDVDAPDAGVGDAGASLGLPAPDALWTVTIARAIIPQTKLNGDPWDAGSTNGYAPPDVFVTATLGSEKTATTTTIMDTFEPEWNERLTLAIPTVGLSSLLTFQIVDEDVAFHDSITTCAIPETPSVFGGGEFALVCWDEVEVLATLSSTE